MSNTTTVTVMYYDLEVIMELKSEVLHHCQIGNGGRVIVPAEFKQDKLIIAVLKGEVEVLNTLGDRMSQEDKVA
ncbi:TIGR02922 family protein [Shewanella algicola]|uniref:TIGR02922 family protein n=1 Tax=Shewanella algicola TaxID=640633 RepID=UPI0024954C04|nr:TIGR02922 family protein [Shewanella algicola]